MVTRMPKHTQHAIITWVPNSKDGQREATKLNTIYKDYSFLLEPSKLTSDMLSNFMSFIVVGHRGEFNDDLYSQLKSLIKDSHCNWLVLANCHSAEARYEGPLGDNELLSPAQSIANDCKIKVSGTTRLLTFDEVGKGYAFALVIGEVLIRSNPYGKELWIDLEPQSDIEELTEMMGRL